MSLFEVDCNCIDDCTVPIPKMAFCDDPLPCNESESESQHLEHALEKCGRGKNLKFVSMNLRTMLSSRQEDTCAYELFSIGFTLQ